MTQHVLIPTDGSPLSLKAVEAGVAFAKSQNARVTIYHALEPFPLYVRDESNKLDPDLLRRVEAETRREGERLVQDAVSIAERAGVPVSVEVDRPVNPYEGIVAAAKRNSCDMVYMGSHGRGSIAGLLLGSVTQKVLAHVDIPVTVYRDPAPK